MLNDAEPAVSAADGGFPGQTGAAVLIQVGTVIEIQDAAICGFPVALRQI